MRFESVRRRPTVWLSARVFAFRCKHSSISQSANRLDHSGNAFTFHINTHISWCVCVCVGVRSRLKHWCAKMSGKYLDKMCVRACFERIFHSMWTRSPSQHTWLGHRWRQRQTECILDVTQRVTFRRGHLELCARGGGGRFIQIRTFAGDSKKRCCESKADCHTITRKWWNTSWMSEITRW